MTGDRVPNSAVCSLKLSQNYNRAHTDTSLGQPHPWDEVGKGCSVICLKGKLVWALMEQKLTNNCKNPVREKGKKKLETQECE